MKAVWQDKVLAESDNTVVVEGNHYFPPDSIKREYFAPSDTHTTCHWKGVASYYHLRVGDQSNADAAWYYPEPKEAAKSIKDHVAFWRGVKVSEQRAQRPPRASFETCFVHGGEQRELLSGRGFVYSRSTWHDSTVLEWLIAERGDLPDQIRVIESLGPSPIPPWVVSKRLQATVRSELRALLLCIHMETRGRALLRRAGLGRFVAAEDRDYDPIREMAKKAERVSLAQPALIEVWYPAPKIAAQ